MLFHLESFVSSSRPTRVGGIVFSSRTTKDYAPPNCFDLRELPLRNYELTINNMGIATCNHCHRKYNLNTGGNIVSGGSGKKLTRYRANSTGPFGVLGVS